MLLNIIGTWVAASLTLAILSFLYKDNPFYKVAEHIYVGTSAGFAVIYAWRSMSTRCWWTRSGNNLASENYIEHGFSSCPQTILAS